MKLLNTHTHTLAYEIAEHIDTHWRDRNDQHGHCKWDLGGNKIRGTHGGLCNLGCLFVKHVYSLQPKNLHSNCWERADEMLHTSLEATIKV